MARRCVDGLKRTKKHVWQWFLGVACSLLTVRGGDFKAQDLQLEGLLRLCFSSSSRCVGRWRHPQRAPISEGALGRPALYIVLFLMTLKEQGCRNEFVPSFEVGLSAPFLLNACMGTASETLAASKVGDALHRLENGWGVSRGVGSRSSGTGIRVTKWKGA